MQEIKEIIQAEAVDHCLKWVAIVSPAAAALVLLLVRVVRRRFSPFVWGVAFCGLVGPVIFGMWRLYSHLVRYDPDTGYFGLQSVKVLLLNLVIFIAVGAVLGVAASYVNSLIKQRKV